MLSLIVAAALGLSVEGQVRCHEIDFSLSVTNQDRAAFAEFLHPGIRFLAGTEVRVGREAFVEQWAGFFGDDGPDIEWRPERVVVLDGGDLAVSRGPFRVTMVQDGEKIEQWGEFMSIWRRVGDRWMVIYDAAAQEHITPSNSQRALLETGSCEHDDTR